VLSEAHALRLLLSIMALRPQTGHNPSLMQFRLVGVIDRFGLHHDGPDHIAFRAGGTQRIRVQLWTDRATGRPRLRYRALATFEPPTRVRRMFESLAAGRYPHGSRAQETLARGAVRTSGRPFVRLAAMSLMPNPFRGFVGALGEDLGHAAGRAIALVRWRTGEIGPPLGAPGTRFEWSLGDGQWHPLPSDTFVELDAYSYPELTVAARDDIVRLFDSGVDEPFAYELIRDAWTQHVANPRSALITAITALEIAVKQFIARRVPAADWLVENVPVPDVIKLMREYLPTLDPPAGAPPSAGRFQELPGPLWQLLRKRRDQRNNVIHKPAAYASDERSDLPPITPERAQSAVLAVREVLYRLDLADGAAWAVAYLGTGTAPAPGAGYRRVG
jgi:hypothetical protein